MPVKYNDFLIRGKDYLESRPDFKLVGRDEELKRLGKVLTRKNASSVILTGPGGVGCSTLILGLEACKDDETVPFDIAGKRFFWLDTDGLFSSGNSNEINENFKKAINTLSSSHDTVLIIDDMRDFVEGARNNHCTNLINVLMREIRNKKFQAILEVDDDDMPTVANCHSDMKEGFTHVDLTQPEGKNLELILEQACSELESHHKIKISPEARKAALEMTSKFVARDPGLRRAQPERTLTLLDRALTSYRLQAHAQNPHIEELQNRIAAIDKVLMNEDYSQDQGGKSKDELEAEHAALSAELEEVKAEWGATQKKIRSSYASLRAAEESISELEEKREAQKQKEEEIRQYELAELKKAIGSLEKEKSRLAQESKEKQQEAKGQREETGVEEEIKTLDGQIAELRESQEAMDNLGDSNAVAEINKNISDYKAAVKTTKQKLIGLTADINEDLELAGDHVLSEFSRITKVPVDKLTQDEKARLWNLEPILKSNVWDQDHAIEKVCNSVMNSRAGLNDDDEPEGLHFWMGPSGVGKTELAKQLSKALEMNLLRLDMSEYQEKHAVAKLIGAPPGYEGFDQGGRLVRDVRRNPRQVILFDEVEQAHPDVFNVLLQVLSAGRLTDSHGLTADFRNCIIILTSNIGKEFFVDPDLTFEEASQKALEALDAHLPPQLLNRFDGRRGIVCFNILQLATILKIARRDLNKVESRVQQKRPELSIHMDDDQLRQLCEDTYKPLEGARGIVGEIKHRIKPSIARTVLFDSDDAGVINIQYNRDDKKVIVHPAKALELVTPGIVKPSAEAIRAFGTQPG